MAEQLVIDSFKKHGTNKALQLYKVKTNKGNFYYAPSDYVLKGVKYGKYVYYDTQFLNDNVLKNAVGVNLDPSVYKGTDLEKQKLFTNPNSGFLIPEKDYDIKRLNKKGINYFDPVQRGGAIAGMTTIDGKNVYLIEGYTNTRQDWLHGDPDEKGNYGGGNIRTITPGKSKFGKLGEIARGFGEFVSGVPLLPEVAGLVTGNPYVYATLKGASLGYQGVDPIKAGIQVGTTVAVSNLLKTPDFTKSVGKTLLGNAASDKAASVVGAAMVGGTANAVVAATLGGDVGKSFLTGATASGVLTGSAEVSEALIGKDGIQSISKATGLSTTEVQNVIARSVVDGAIASANGEDFLKATGKSLVANGLSTKASKTVTDSLKTKVGKDTLDGIGTATAGIVRTSTTAIIDKKDIVKALEKDAPGIVLSSLTAALDKPAEPKKPKEPEKVVEAPVDTTPPAGETIATPTPEVPPATPPVLVAGDATGIGLLLDQKFSPSDVEVSSRVVDGVRETVYEGFDNNGQNYRYSIIGTPQGNTYYSFIDSAGQKQFSVADPTTRTELEGNLFSGAVGKLDPISGALIIEVAGVGGAGEPVAPLPITAGLDLRQYVGAEGAGRAIIGRGGRPGGKSTGINLLGRDSATGLDKFDINGEGFTLLVLPGDRQALISDVRDVVYFPTLTEDTKELRLDEAPLETLIPKTETPPAELPTGPAAGGEEGVTGPEGALGGLISFEDVRQKEKENLVAKIIEDELQALEKELADASEARRIAEQNLQRSLEQTARLTRLPERTRIPTAIQEILDAEIGNLERASREAEDLERSLTTRKEEIGAVQQGEAELSDEDILGYLETGRLPSGGTVTGPGAGTGATGEGEGALAPGEGEGAGEEGEGVGGGEEGGAGDGGLQPRIGGRVVFNRLDLPESRPFASRVTGEALASILGAKEPLFGGDEDEQQAVWNRRSLRLRKALGL